MHIGAGKKLILALPLIFAVMSPFVAFGASAAVKSNVWNPSILQGPLVTCLGSGTNPAVPYTCTSVCDFVSTFANVVYFFIGVVIWIIAPIMVAISGIMLMLSQGNPGKRDNARKMITGTVVGLLIVISAYLIIYTFIKVIGGTTLSQYIGGFGTNACPL